MTNSPRRGGCFGRSIVTVIIVLVIACIALAGIAYVVAGPAIINLFNAIAAPISASNDFMNDLIAKDYTKAYSLIHPSQQANFGGSAQAMQQSFSGQEPSSYTFASAQTLTTGQTVVNGTGNFGGTTKYVTMFLQKDGDTWKIVQFGISDNQPTAIPTVTG
ncbi:MAG: hypothetical protein ACYDBJ_01435 [Aggregatilineales bacterium]